MAESDPTTAPFRRHSDALSDPSYDTSGGIVCCPHTACPHNAAPTAAIRWNPAVRHQGGSRARVSRTVRQRRHLTSCSNCAGTRIRRAVT